MFTGIIETIGEVMGVRQGTSTATTGRATRLDVRLGDLLADVKLGASVAINGVCLTRSDARGDIGGFDVVPETLRHSTLQHLRPGSLVNLERALSLGDRIDGHFVQGHVDGTGTVDKIDRGSGEWKLWLSTRTDLFGCIVPKGSVAIDGVSLTIVDVEPRRFSVALIPTTLSETTLGRRREGDQINIETDILARLVMSRLEQFLPAARPDAASGGITWERLRDAGLAP
ncbi:MAG: riboflavin synthase [Phycisphaerae bacterium]|nr:riboflavin synthase [Phycisphaerae bacterium]